MKIDIIMSVRLPSARHPFKVGSLIARYLSSGTAVVCTKPEEEVMMTFIT